MDYAKQLTEPVSCFAPLFEPVELIQIIPPSGEQGELITGVLDFLQVHLHQNQRWGIVCLSQDLPQGEQAREWP